MINFKVVVEFEVLMNVSIPVELRYKRRPEMDTNGFYGDTFSGGWGEFYPAGKRGIMHSNLWGNFKARFHRVSLDKTCLF